MTPLSDIKSIVPSEDLWIAVGREYWNDGMAVLDWNSSLMSMPEELRPPISAVKVGLFTEIFRRGKVCRPIKEYIDFRKKPMFIEK